MSKNGGTCDEKMWKNKEIYAIIPPKNEGRGRDLKFTELRRTTVFSESGRVTLVYSLIEYLGSYGIMIEALEWAERAVVTDVSNERSEVESMIAAFSEGSVFPVSLYDVVYDRLSE